jgi:hypothetical protein
MRLFRKVHLQGFLRKDFRIQSFFLRGKALNRNSNQQKTIKRDDIEGEGGKLINSIISLIISVS